MAPISLGAKLALGFFLTLYFILLLGIALTPDALRTPVALGLTAGHWLVLAIHVLPVVAAWLYMGREP